MSAVRDSANLRFTSPVDGTKKARSRKRSSQRVMTKNSFSFRVDPRIMKAAKAARRPGEKIYPVSETEVVIRP